MIVRGVALLLLLVAIPAAAGVTVTLRGLDGDARDNVEQRLSIRHIGSDEVLDELLVERLHQQADSDIRNALQPFGYYSPTITGSLTGEPPNWQASYSIDPGPVTRITAIDVTVDGEGKDFDAIARAAAHLPLRQGAPLLHSDYENAKMKLSQAAFAGGFLDAHYSASELRVDPSTQSAQIVLHLNTGPRYFFGPIQIEQQGLDPALPERYLTIHEGDAFDPQKVLETQFALTDLGYFQTVEILPHRDQAVDNHVPITIHTTPRARARYQAGAGYGTDTGARVSLGSEFRRLNEGGHTLRTDLRLSQIKSSLTNEYRIPLGKVAADSLSFTAGASYEKISTGDDTKYQLGASLNRTPGRWQRRIYVDFVHERTNLNDAPSSSNLVMPGISFTRGEYDDPIHTRRGWFAFLDGHGASTDLLSTSTFLQLHGVVRSAYPLGRRLTLLARAEVGASFVPNLSTLPPSQRFFAGGDQSVRGYGYQSIGPRDSTGTVVGGKYLGVFSIEPDLRVYGNWSVAAFYDLGGVDDDPAPKLFGGAGAGVRYRAPIGEVRIDIAHPMTGDTRGVRLHLGVRVGL
ncbi:MAG: outer membrane protein assembly factor [Nevskiaceae bacterium]|nr:MAG: outer membrane protein assembly factor [Nevskiaceae bacterium]